MLFLVTGKTHDAEETVLTDYLTGSARKREFPEREKQFAYHASEGKTILCMLFILICKYLILFTWRSYPDVCRRERNWHLWKESMQSCLRGRPTLTTLLPSQRWVSVTVRIILHIPTSRVLLCLLTCITLWMTNIEMSCYFYPFSFFCDSSDFCDHCSTCNLWRKGEEAAKKTLPTRLTAYLIRGASSSSPLMADPWDARFPSRSSLF